MSTSKPHDNFFRENFGQVEVARDYLQNYLPAPLLARLDLDNMALQDGSFVDPELQDSHSDLLYLVHLKEGASAFVFFLFEHKSFPDEWVAFQILRYMVRIWEQQRKGGETLTPVIPLVVYHGKSKWEVRTDFGALVSAPEEIRPYIPNFHYQLRDFSHLAEEEIKGAIILRVLLMAMRNIHNPHFRDELTPFLTYLFQLKGEKVPSGLDYLYRVLYYISRYAKHITRRDVYHALQAQDEQGDEPFMTIAQEYIQEGFEKGIAQGLEQGLEKGLQKGLETGLEKGLEKGLQKGLQKGRQETLRQIVLRLAEKHSLVTVSELLGLPIEEVVELAQTDSSSPDDDPHGRLPLSTAE